MREESAPFYRGLIVGLPMGLALWGALGVSIYLVVWR